MNKHMLPSRHQTRREAFELGVMGRFPQLQPFSPDKHHSLIHDNVFGTFGLASTALALYGGGYNPRGESKIAPCSLIWNGDGVIFGLGYYRNEKDSPDSDGYAMIIAPQPSISLVKLKVHGWMRLHSFVQSAVRVVDNFVRAILLDPSIPCKGVYLRHLDSHVYGSLYHLSKLPGHPPSLYVPAVMNYAWHPEAEFEDETYASSTIYLPHLFGDARGDAAKKAQLITNRFSNFCKRNGLEFSWRAIDEKGAKVAEEIISGHFGVLRALGKAIGSTEEDYFAITRHILGKYMREVYQFFGCLNGLPMAVFVAEGLKLPLNIPVRIEGKYDRIPEDSIFYTSDCAGLYVSIASRNTKYVFGKLGLDPNEMIDNLPSLVKKGDKPQVPRSQGFSAFPLFCVIEFARMLYETRRIRILSLGGSETEELQDAKESIGAISQRPLPWLFKSRAMAESDVMENDRRRDMAG